MNFLSRKIGGLSTLGVVFLLTAQCTMALPAQQDQSPQPPPKIIRKSGGVLTGSAITRVEPTYPALAKAAHVQGSVVVEITIDEDGSVIAANAISGNALLQDAAVQAAHHWKFKPTTLQGVAVKVIGTITFNFFMGGDASVIDKAKDLVAANPASDEAWLELGKAYTANSQYPEATDALKQAIKLKPDSPAAYLLLGSALSRQGQYEEEVKVYRDAQRTFPNSTEFLRPLARALARSQRWDEALEVQKQLVASSAPNDTWAYLDLGEYQFKTKNYAEAVTSMKHVLEMDPQYSLPASAILAASYEALGQFQDAIDVYQHALDSEPDNPFLLDHIGWAFHEMGHPDQAEPYLVKAVQIAARMGVPGNDVPTGVPSAVPGNAAGRGVVILRESDNAYGLPKMMDHLGDVYLANGKKDLAVDAWQKALKLATDPVDISRLKEKLSAQLKK